MIALDTNILVRLLTRDDPNQAERARLLFEKHAAEDGGGDPVSGDPVSGLYICISDLPVDD